MVCALHAVNCSCSVYVKSQTVLSGLEWKPTLTSSSPAGASPGGASAVPFGPVLPGRTGNKRTSWGRFLKVWGGQEPGWREVPSARSQWSGGWMDLRPVFACRSGGRAPGFSLSSVQFAWFSPSCLFSEVRGH